MRYRNDEDVTMDHYITGVQIDSLINLSNIEISLCDESRQHLLLTGKNGSGKTTLLNAIRTYLQSINDGNYHTVSEQYASYLEGLDARINASTSLSEKDAINRQKANWENAFGKYFSGAIVRFNEDDGLDGLYGRGEFITAWFPADRSLSLPVIRGVEEVVLKQAYPISASPVANLTKYLVHLRTQQAYAKNEGDVQTERLLESWFDRFESALRELLGDPTAKLVYDFKRYSFQIETYGRKPFGLNQLSDGYSSVLQILSDLMLRMDHNWLSDGVLRNYDVEGVVLIDELETHLHIELQKKVLPFLTTFFPRLQFIVSTHSPYILSSISNAKIYDLARSLEVEDLSSYSADEVAEGYFSAEEYSDLLLQKLSRYQELKARSDVSSEEAAERARLRLELKTIPTFLGSEARAKFEDIERGVVR